MNNHDSIILLSGGMDSTTLLYHVVKELKRTPVALVVNYGQKHTIEIHSAYHHCHKLGITPVAATMTDLFSMLDIQSALMRNNPQAIPPLEEVAGDPQPPTYVPNRNMILLSLAAGMAESIGVDTIFYGAQYNDMYGYWDCTADFLIALNNVLQLNRRTPVTIAAPFISFSKTDILTLGRRLDVDYAYTWSCYEGDYLGACGKCATCRERLKAFANLQMLDPIKYKGGQ